MGVVMVGAAPVKRHNLHRRRRVRARCHHRHRRVLIDAQRRAVRAHRPEAVRHPKPDGMRAQAQDRQTRPRHRRHRTRRVVVLTVVVDVPRVRDN